MPGYKEVNKMERNDMVMLIDDDPVFAEAFRRTLESRSFPVLAVPGEDEMRRALDENEPGIIVLGTLAPTGKTFAIQQWLKVHPRYRDIPLLVIGAPETEEKGLRRFEGFQLMSDDYVAKPIEPGVLVPRIQGLLEKAVRRIKVLVADDHTMIRDGICTVLALQKDVDVVGEAVNGQDACDKALRLMPNVVLMDIVMPVMSGLEAAKRILRECPHTRILILTQYDEEENMLVARQVGARGFIPKRAASSDLVTGIRSVFAGEYFPNSFASVN